MHIENKWLRVEVLVETKTGERTGLFEEDRRQRTLYSVFSPIRERADNLSLIKKKFPELYGSSFEIFILLYLLYTLQKKHIHTSTQVNTIQIDYKHKNTHKTKCHLHL